MFQIPAGSLPRTVEVILRESYVERIRPGDFMIFTGTVVAIPDVSVIANPGERVSRMSHKSTHFDDLF